MTSQKKWSLHDSHEGGNRGEGGRLDVRNREKEQFQNCDLEKKKGKTSICAEKEERGRYHTGKAEKKQKGSEHVKIERKEGGGSSRSTNRRAMGSRLVRGGGIGMEEKGGSKTPILKRWESL